MLSNICLFVCLFSYERANMRNQGMEREVRRWTFLNGCFFLLLPCERNANWTLKFLDVQRRKACVQCWPLMRIFILGVL